MTVVVPCSFGSNVVGKQNSAEWVRTVFHDAITHDKATGLGGLDASIMFETHREENTGDAFNNTMSEAHEFVSPSASGADMLALGLVASVAACGGPRIPLRTGRIDATEAGPPGVPKPDHTLESTIDTFARAGFDKSDMIALVACGHTLGGVHSINFPDITGGESSPSNKKSFDQSPGSFNPDVAVEYLDGDGANPLVFGHNDTTNSDKRIFASDGNSTITKMRDPEAFSALCGDVFERLLNTVPSTVELSEPIVLVDVKPYVTRYEVISAENTTSIAFEGRVRVRTSSDTGYNDETLAVFLDLKPRKGGNQRVEALRARFRGGQSFGFYNEVFTWYEFATELDVAAGLQSFDIHLVEDADGNGTKVFDNAGTGGYSVNDGLLFQQTESCLDTTAYDSTGNFTLKVQAVVRKDLLGDSNAAPVLQYAHRISQQGAVFPRISIEVREMELQSSGNSPYSTFSASIPVNPAAGSSTFEIELTAGGQVLRSGFQRTNQLTSGDCRA